MCFGENPAPAAALCKFCGLAQADAGWTLWRPYSALPAAAQRRVDRAHGPKVLSVLRTRWPEAAVAAVRAVDGAEAELGTAAFEPAAFKVPAV